MSLPKVYIAGAITTDPNYLLKFERCQKMIECFGVDVVNPCKLNHRKDATFQEHLRVDIAAMLLCDSVYFMKDWRQSRGATMEMKMCLEFNINYLIEGFDNLSRVFYRDKISNLAVTSDGQIIEFQKL